MAGFTIEYQGDDHDILDYALRRAVEGAWVVNIRTDGDAGEFLGQVAEHDTTAGTVSLSEWDDECDGPTGRLVVLDSNAINYLEVY